MNPELLIYPPSLTPLLYFKEMLQVPPKPTVIFLARTWSCDHTALQKRRDNVVSPRAVNVHRQWLHSCPGGGRRQAGTSVYNRQEESVGEMSIFPKVLWEQTGFERGQPSFPFTSPPPVSALKLCQEEHMHKFRSEVMGDFYPCSFQRHSQGTYKEK